MADLALSISASIKRRRTDLNLTLEDVAERAGTSKSHIWALEQGRSSNPTLSMALSLCSALCMSLNELIGVDASNPYTPQEMRLIAAHREIFRSKA